ncbi:MAG: hypothetical protein U1E65_10515 [Myxococcota bacterium]
MSIPGTELLRRTSTFELGERWLAKKSGRPVWIWVSPPLGEGARAVVLEADAARSVRHPSLAEVVETGTSDGHAYQVLNAAPAEDLRSLGALPPSVAAKIVHDVARAIDHARAQGRLFGRLTADQVLVAYDGTVSVLGLGLAASLAKQLGLPPLSPEGRRGTVLTPASDVYALGEILAFACGGADGMPAALRAVVERAKSEDPARRHADANALADAIASAAAVEFKALPANDDLGQFMRTTYEAKMREIAPVFGATAGVALFGSSVGQLFVAAKPRTSSSPGRGGSGPTQPAGSGPSAPAGAPSGSATPARPVVLPLIPTTPAVEPRSSVGVLATLVVAASAAFLFGLLFLGPRARYASTARDAFPAPDPAPRLRRLPALSVPPPSQSWTVSVPHPSKP